MREISTVKDEERRAADTFNAISYMHTILSIERYEIDERE
jgi:hypothetical protein